MIMRGGTSKAVFFHHRDLPEDPSERDRTLLAAFGSPDQRQINGLGGATPVTSKTAIIAPSGRPDADVNYTFGQVSIEHPLVEYSGNCGNISAAVGPFAVDEGLVEAREPVTVVRILNTNTGKRIIAEVPVKNGKALTQGECQIAGVAGTGAPIKLQFVDPGGAVTGNLLVNGEPRRVLQVNGLGPVTVSLVDAGNPFVFVAAKEAGIEGTELPAQLEADWAFMERAEKIRGAAAEAFGIVEDQSQAAQETPDIPKIAFIAPPHEYTTIGNVTIRAEQIHLLARMTVIMRPIAAYAVTGAVCTGAAAKIPGSVVYEAIPPERRNGNIISIGHPDGIMEVEVDAREAAGEHRIVGVTVLRTARRLMEGSVYVST